MQATVRRIWLSVLSALILFGMGLQTLPIPCQAETCSTDCAQVCTTCPPSCTCHLSMAKAPVSDGPGGHAGHGVQNDSADAASLQCAGGVSDPGLPDVALPNPPPPALLSLAPALVLVQLPALPMRPWALQATTRSEPLFRPPTA